jgi:hypothetical protein
VLRFCEYVTEHGSLLSVSSPALLDCESTPHPLLELECYRGVCNSLIRLIGCSARASK